MGLRREELSPGRTFPKRPSRSPALFTAPHTSPITSFIPYRPRYTLHLLHTLFTTRLHPTPVYKTQCYPFKPTSPPSLLQHSDIQSDAYTMAATITIASGATWQEVAADRQEHREATLSLLSPPLPPITSSEIPKNTIPLAQKYLTAEEIAVTETPVETLLPQLASGTVSSVTVTSAFLRRAGLAQLAVIPPLYFPSPLILLILEHQDKLHNRAPPQLRTRARRISRRVPLTTPKTNRTITWAAN